MPFHSINHICQWVQMKTWGIESIEALGDYVILDMRYKKKRINLLMHARLHTFSSQYCVNNVGIDLEHIELRKLFSKYHLSNIWTARKLNGLLLNMTKVDNTVEEANKKTHKSPLPRVQEDHEALQRRCVHRAGRQRHLAGH